MMMLQPLRVALKSSPQRLSRRMRNYAWLERSLLEAVTAAGGGREQRRRAATREVNDMLLVGRGGDYMGREEIKARKHEHARK